MLVESIREIDERSLVGPGWDEVDEKGAVRVRLARQGFDTHVRALTLNTGVVATDGSGGCSDAFDKGQVAPEGRLGGSSSYGRNHGDETGWVEARS